MDREFCIVMTVGGGVSMNNPVVGDVTKTKRDKNAWKELFVC